MNLQRQEIRKLRRTEADFERQRFEYYASERASRLDNRAREAWELYHNDRDGTSTSSAEHLPPTQDIQQRQQMQQLTSQQATPPQGPVTPRSRHSNSQTGHCFRSVK